MYIAKARGPPRRAHDADETGSQTNARLLAVIVRSAFEILPDVYAFEPLREMPGGLAKDALACVRDGHA